MQKKATANACKRFSLMFGGSTTTKAVGYWFSSEKGLISEAQNLVYSYCTEAGKAAHLESVKTFAKAVCRWMKQEAVTVDNNGTLLFIEA